VLEDADTEAILHTLSTSTIVASDSVRIDITPIVQGYVLGSLPKNGIVVKSLQK